jgi:hypothetical protein
MLFGLNNVPRVFIQIMKNTILEFKYLGWMWNICSPFIGEKIEYPSRIKKSMIQKICTTQSINQADKEIVSYSNPNTTMGTQDYCEEIKW